MSDEEDDIILSELEDDDLVASGYGSRETHRSLNRFGAGANKAGPFVPGDFAEEFRGFHRDALIRSYLKASV